MFLAVFDALTYPFGGAARAAGASMAKQSGEGASAGGARMLTLSAVSKRTGISMPTLQKYKREHSARIPSRGKGRRQRYPEEAIAAFQKLREEGMARRGRPRKDASTGRGRKRPGAAREGRRSGLITLGEVAKRTGISYPTLLRYVKVNLARLPHQGAGRRRRFEPAAVAVFRQLRKESRPGRPPGSKTGTGRDRGRAASAAGGAAASRLVATVRGLERRIAQLEREMKKPLRVEVRR